VVRGREIKAVRLVMKMNVLGKKEEEDQKRDGWIRLRMI
jgi:hypothetical protein